jgi:flagellar hook protein FlgE
MSFQQGLSGLNASSKALDTVGNNIANAGTVGYKLGNTQFADVFAASLSGAGTSPIGLGAKVATVVQQFTQGNISVTSNPLDMAINGGGFFRLQSPNGDAVYSRNGQFQLDKDGYIVNASGYQLTGYAADNNGTINPPLVALRLFDPTSSSDAAPQATGASAAATGVQVNLNLDSREAAPTGGAFDYRDATTYNKSTAVTTYDSLGNPHTYSLYFVKAAAPATNTWRVYSTVANPAGATPTFTDLSAGGTTTLTTLTFNTDGTVAGGGTPTQTITAAELGYPGGVDPMTAVPINFSGTTQFGSLFTVNSLLQDGYASGKLAGFTVGDDGVVLGKYTNGQSRNLGQVILASFRNPQGLQPLGNNLWSATSTSGSEMDGAPGSSGQYGPLQSSALEDSNVDLTAELVNMITQQRVYQANAQTIKTQDQVLQTLVNLR